MWTITPNCSHIIVDAAMVAGSPLSHRSGLALQVVGKRDFKFGLEIGSRLKFLVRTQAARRVEGSKVLRHGSQPPFV